MKRFHQAISLAILAAITLAAGCANEAREASPIRTTGEAASRFFHMSFTTFAYTATDEAKRYTYDAIGEHADTIFFHFDEGVPWKEVYNKEPYPPEVEAALDERQRLAPAGHKIIVAATPLNGDRSGLAGTWSTGTNQPRFGIFREKTYDDLEVMDTYTQFCKDLIERFKPDYFIYGIEVNLLGKNKPDEWEPFAKLMKHTYGQLKAAYPELPVAFSVQLGDFYENEKADRRNLAQLVEFTDFLAVSSYPYPYAGSKLPDDYFSAFRTLAPDKPFAVAETGMIAEDLAVGDVKLNSNEEDQNRYVNTLLNAAQKENALFVNWFLIRDYDEFMKLLGPGASPIWLYWRDTGLIDGGGKPRSGLNTWKQWLELPVANK